MIGIKMVFTKHSITRMRERGISLENVFYFLTKFENYYVSKIKHGYELKIPSKGRLVGDFVHNKFIIKTYNFPTFTNYKNQKGSAIKISNFSFPNMSS